MENFKLHHVKRLVELYRIEQVNNYLELGWVLINTYKAIEHPNFPNEMMRYVLGWAKDESPAKPEYNHDDEF